MKIYAIRNKDTGEFLENKSVFNKTRAKFSNKNIRVFTRKSSASNALKCWQMGIWHNRTDAYGECYSPQPPNKVPEDRKNLNIEIVEAEIEFK